MKKKKRNVNAIKIAILILGLCLCANALAITDDWQITAYCSCPVCCGKWSDGYMASGVKCKEGYIACNILPFGTKVSIEDIGIYIVKDRGSKRYFDNKRHIDIYMSSHLKAKEFGVKYKKVKILK